MVGITHTLKCQAQMKLVRISKKIGLAEVGEGWNKYEPNWSITSHRSFTLKWLPGNVSQPLGLFSPNINTFLTSTLEARP